MNINEIYIQLNIHVLSENDWNYVREEINNILNGNIIEFKPLTSTSIKLRLKDSNSVSLEKLKSLKFVEFYGYILCDEVYNQDKIFDIINRIKELKDKLKTNVIVKSRIFTLKNKLTILERLNNINLIYILCKTQDVVHLIDRFYDTNRTTIHFIICEVESSQEILNILRCSCALKVKVYLINPKPIRDRKYLKTYKKFLSLSKSKIFERIEDAVNYLKKKYKDNIVLIGLSMHCKAGDKTLIELIEKSKDKQLVFIIGSEKWGFTVKEVKYIDYMIRLGPSIGIPLSISEVITYITSMIRTLNLKL